jgi:DNA-binding MarR family transcriptional regulator
MASIDDEVKTNFMNDRHRFFVNLVFTSAWLQGLTTEYLRPFGVSSQQFNILRILRGAKDWVAMNDIKDLMVDKAPNATRLADKLIDKGLIERRRSNADRRVVYINITKKGQALLKEIDKVQKSGPADLFDRITDEEANRASDVLDKLRG